MVGSGGLLLLDAFLEGRLAGSSLYTASFLVVAGMLLTSYFVYLVQTQSENEARRMTRLEG